MMSTVIKSRNLISRVYKQKNAHSEYCLDAPVGVSLMYSVSNSNSGSSHEIRNTLFSHLMSFSCSFMVIRKPSEFYGGLWNPLRMHACDYLRMTK